MELGVGVRFWGRGMEQVSTDGRGHRRDLTLDEGRNMGEIVVMRVELGFGV